MEESKEPRHDTQEQDVPPSGYTAPRTNRSDKTLPCFKIAFRQQPKTDMVINKFRRENKLPMIEHSRFKQVPKKPQV